MVTNFCEFCFQKYIPKHKSHRYCSHFCAKKNYSNNNKARVKISSRKYYLKKKEKIIEKAKEHRKKQWKENNIKMILRERKSYEKKSILKSNKKWLERKRTNNFYPRAFYTATPEIIELKKGLI